jgi:methionine sulfoxide reductase heme-binding subunit
MNEILWYLSRATGMVCVVLLTATFVLGLLTSGRAAPIGAPAWVRARLHRTLSLILVVFLGVHVVTAVVETFVDIGWLSAIVPFTSAYDTLWVGLGTLAVDLLLAVAITSLLRSRIPLRAWRYVHLLAYAMWPLALLHGWGTSTSDGTAMLAITATCAAVGGTAIAWRATRVLADSRQRLLATAQGWR